MMIRPYVGCRDTPNSSPKLGEVDARSADGGVCSMRIYDTRPDRLKNAAAPGIARGRGQ